MTTLVLIPSGQTTWQEEGRMVGSADLPLSDTGRQQVTSWADQLKQLPVDILYAGTNEQITETVELLGSTLKIKGKLLDSLDEISLGLWQGLHTDQIKQRYAKAWKQWQQQPQTVCPPEGETLRQAQQRLQTAIDKILNKHHDKTIGLVLGPLALAVIRANREGSASDQIWPLSQQPLDWYKYQISDSQLLTNE